MASHYTATAGDITSTIKGSGTSLASAISMCPTNQEALSVTSNDIDARSLPSPGAAAIPPKKVKKVRWDPSVVDNTIKPRPRVLPAANAAAPRRPLAPLSVRSMPSSPLGSATTNTSAKIRPPFSRQQATQEPRQSHRERSAGSKSSPHNRPRASTSTANMSSRITSSPSSPRPPKIKIAVPPRVPDAPRMAPPAPRPRRLLTPDLPAVDEFVFFGQEPSLMAQDSHGKPHSTKMDSQGK